MNAALRTSLPRWPVLAALRPDETGATAVEYGLIAALVALALLGGLKALGADLVGLPLQSIVNAIQSVA